MAKKREAAPRQRSSQLESPRAIQKRWLQLLREEVSYLHALSLQLMEERGILPPMYGGDWLDNRREVIPLWGVLADDQEELGMLLLRIMDGVEPNKSLRDARAEIEMVNDWPLDDLLAHLGTADRPLPVEGGDGLRGMRISLALFGSQCEPAPGYDPDGMLEAIGEEKPLAVFVQVPVTRDGGEFAYNWNDFEHYRAQILWADTPEGLEMAIWHYRLDLALADEKAALEAEGADLDTEMIAPNVSALTGVFDIMIMEAMRYYGVTSPVSAKQAMLDVERGEDGDLVVRAPLKVPIEPVPLLAEIRSEFKGDEDGVILRIHAGSEIMTTVWPQVRPYAYFCMRLRQGEFGLTKGGQPRVRGYLSSPVVEWITANSLPELYLKTTLHCLRQLLVSIGRIKVHIDAPEIDDEDESEED